MQTDKGIDYMLAQLVSDLEFAGILKHVWQVRQAYILNYPEAEAKKPTSTACID